MSHETLRSFTRNYILSISLFDLVFAYAIYAILFAMEWLSTFTISLLFTFWSATSLLLEIPSGALADKWSRKNMLILAPIMKVLCMLFWFFANGNVWLYWIGFFFWSLGSTFRSGTKEALLYDTLKHYGKTEEYAKILWKAEFWNRISQAGAFMLWGILGSFDIRLPLLASIPPLLLATYFASRLHDAPKWVSTDEVHYFEYMKMAFHEVKINPHLWILFTFSLIFVFGGMLDEFIPLYSNLVSIPIWLFGIIACVSFSLEAVYVYFAFRISSFHFISLILPLTVGGVIVWAWYTPSWMWLLLVAGILPLLAPLSILINEKLQHAINSESRATISSGIGFVEWIFEIILMPFFGALASWSSIGSIFLLSWVVIAWISIMMFPFLQHSEEK